MKRTATILFVLSLLLALLQVGQAQPTIDGDLSDSEYTKIATKQNSNSGFGSGKDVNEIFYYVDEASGVLYFGIKGTLDAGAGDGIGFWWDFSQLNGDPAGTALGGVSSAGHYMGAGNSDFKADFEVDYMFALNAGGGSENAFLDVVKQANGEDADYMGEITAIDGTSTTNGPADGQTNNGNASFFSQGSVTFAYDNSDGTNTGFEMSIPLSELSTASNSVTTEGDFRAFAAVVSSTAFFSDVTVPGNVTGGNAGNDPNFNTLSGGPYNSGSNPLPVELASFTAQREGQIARLRWTTASETNNAGFAVQHATGPDGAFQKIGYRESKAQGGTTSEAQTYRLDAEDLAPGTHRFRLQQQDLDGSKSLSDVRTVEIRPAGAVAVEGVTPHPVRGPATFRFGVQERQSVTVTLFDVMGRRIETLYEGPATPGAMTTVRIPGDLSSGLYLVRVEGQTFQRTQRITVIE